MRTHIDTLLDDTPKARRRIRRMGAESASQAVVRAVIRERREALWYYENQNASDPTTREMLRKKGYTVR